MAGTAAEGAGATAAPDDALGGADQSADLSGAAAATPVDAVPPDSIVVGVDGSATALAAVAWAAHAAQAYAVPLALVYGRAGVAAAGQPRVSSEVLSQAVDVARNAEPLATVVSVEMAESPVNALLEASKTARAVVIGSRGLGGFFGMLVGSTAMLVVPYASCPVVVVRAPSAGEDVSGLAVAARMAPGAQVPAVGPSTHSGAVVIGYDDSEYSDSISRVGLDYASRTGARVVAVLVGDHEAEPGEPTAQDRFNAVAAKYPDVRADFLATSGRPATRLAEEGADSALLVVGSRGRGGFRGLVMGSVSQQLLHHATCPILVVQDPVVERLREQAAGGHDEPSDPNAQG